MASKLMKQEHSKSLFIPLKKVTPGPALAVAGPNCKLVGGAPLVRYNFYNDYRWSDTKFIQSVHEGPFVTSLEKSNKQ